MTDPSSLLAERVRRLLGPDQAGHDAGPPQPSALHQGASPQPSAPSPDTQGRGRTRPDSGALFESQLSRLNHAIRDLHAIDRAREIELRHLRERLAIAEATAHAELVERLAPVLAQLDALIGEAARLLQPPPAPSPATTLFERMQARAAGERARREALVAWASTLIDLRLQLAALGEPLL